MRVNVACATLAAGALLAACGSTDREPPLAGDPERGRLLLRQYGCGQCHRIAEVATADADVGPPLAGVGRRIYLAGVLPNSPDNMVRWILAPQSVKPQTTMPDLKVQPAHAVDMVAYLQRLR